jgi:hypothetical protein
VDAVKRVRSMVEAMVSREGAALTVTLDVTNAFNTIPWDGIMEALEHFDPVRVARRREPIRRRESAASLLPSS